jgi:hypothetical protein
MPSLQTSTLLKVAAATLVVGGIGWSVVAASRRSSPER